MKKDAIVINTSRGNIIDENALIEALEEGNIWGVGLDVYENELNINERLIEVDFAVLFPNLGGCAK